MSLLIAVHDRLLEQGLDIPEDERETVEELKEKQKVDQILAASARGVGGQRMAGLEANWTPEARAAIHVEVEGTLDVVIPLIALSENVEEVERLKRVGVMLGRHHNRPVKVNTQLLWPALRKAFEQIADELGVHDGVPHKQERAFIRRKVKAAIKLINESFANRDTHWE